MVFGSLLEVANDYAMVTAADLGLVTADLGPLCDHLVAHRFSVVFNRSFKVGECCTMVFSSVHKVSLVFSSWRSLIVRDQSASVTNQSPTGG